MAVLDDHRKGAQLLGLEARHHRQVGMIPIAEHAQALEVLALRRLACRVLAAGGAKRLGVDLLPDPAMGLLDLHLDRQAVAIPARNVRRIVAVQVRDLTMMSLRILLTAWPR
jgi:hypothetical protein